MTCQNVGWRIANATSSTEGNAAGSNGYRRPDDLAPADGRTISVCGTKR